MSGYSDTIAAIASGGGISAIGIVRLSGPEVLRAVDAVIELCAGIPIFHKGRPAW